MTPEQIVSRFEALKSDRAIFESHWQECADYLLPRKNNITGTASPGEKKGATLYDSTAVQANELLAGALHGMLTNPATVWFELTTGDQKLDQNDAVRKWLQVAGHVMHQTLNNSNFQTEIHEVYLDLGAFGTAVLDVMEDDDRDVRFAARQISELVVEENNRGVIDCFYRSFDWTARQIVMEFGYDNCPEKVQKAFDDNKSDQFTIIHAVYARDLDKIDRAKYNTPKGYKYASCYVLVDGKHCLSESGFREFPTAIPRWTKITGEVYGRSPGMKALPDVKMLNEMKKAVIRSAQKTIDPPLLVPDDGIVGTMRFNPGALNYYRSGMQDKIEPLVTNPRVDIGRDLILDTRGAVKEAFYIDQLQLNQGPQMTATEVQQRTEEKMRLLGPMLGRQQSELLAPLIERVFNILIRKGKIPTAPDVLRGKSWEVRYSSLIARAQRTSEAQNLTRTIELVSPFVQINPEVMDNFDEDEAARYAAQIHGLPANILRDATIVKKMREARSQARQQSLQQASEQHQADMVQKVVPAMAKAKENGMV